ncbi:MAG: DUF2333 family protein [Rhodospirillales bacterium]|nr:DUF2333 family protein [Rhodospirillales bacterium]
MEKIFDMWDGLVDRIKSGSLSSRGIYTVLALVVATVLLYYPIGMVVVHSIDDDISLAVDDTAPGSSRTIAMAATLIERQTDTHRWTANDPWFLPGAALDNMPNYQQGVISALSRFAIEMSDQIGRTRGSSQVDSDLDKAAGLLKYSGTVWVFDFSTSIAPTATSEAQYRAARKSLLKYNTRLAEGNAVFESRADNLQATIERITADLGSASAVVEQHISDSAGGFYDFRADDIFYRTKGRLYAYYLLLREMESDFSKTIGEKSLSASWKLLLGSLKAVAELQPWVVANGSLDGQIVPNHLAIQGFYLLRARTQLKEISNILLK